MKIINAVILFLSIFSLPACSDTEKTNGKKLPETKGLVKSGDEGKCNSLGKYATFLEFGEYDYQLGVFKGKKCKNDKKIISITLDAEARLLGEWNSRLIIDLGTSSTSRTLELIDPSNESEKISIDYIGEPIFTQNRIEVFRLESTHEEQLNSPLCPSVSLVEGAPPSPQSKASKWTYNVKDSKLEKTNESNCYSLE